MTSGAETQTYTVVVNDEDQYSIWPSNRGLPAGWRVTGEPGTREECLAYINVHWTDMRPLSLRRQMDGDGAALDGVANSDGVTAPADVQ
jgi:MbtH protein